MDIKFIIDEADFSRSQQSPEFYKKKICIKFANNFKDDKCKACQRPKVEHESHEEVAVWNSKDCTKTERTDSYGKLNFSGLHCKRASYIRIADDTEPADFLQYMYSRKCWGLKMPNIVLSVIGGSDDFNLPMQIKKAFKRGLMKVATNTGAWIITDGINAGTSKLVGEAVADGSHKDSPTVIGVVPWGAVAFRDKMKVPLNYYESIGENKYAVNNGSELLYLDPNHTHFIFVDDGTVNQLNTAAEFRLALEKEIRKGRSLKEYEKQQHLTPLLMSLESRTTSNSSNTDQYYTVNLNGDLTMPTILIVVNGNIHTLKLVLLYLENKIPVLVLAGSKGIADVIAKVVARKDINRDEVKAMLVSICEIPENEKIIDDLIRTCQINENLINVFRPNHEEGFQDIELEILRTFLNSQKDNFYENLKFAIKLNRYDIAKKDIFTGDEKFDPQDLDDLMQIALEDDRHEFVELILEKGILFGKFLTNMRLYYLYNSDKVRKTKPPIYELLRVMGGLNKTVSREYIMFKDIGEIFKRLIFDRFNYENYITKDIDDASVIQFMKETFKISEMSPKIRRLNSKTNGETINLWRAKENIFLWALLMNRTKIAKLVWPYFNNQIFNALFACKILKSVADNIPDDEAELRESAMEFEELAIGCLELYDKYTENGMNRILLLHRNTLFKMNVLEMAVEADCKKFVSNPATQGVLTSIWYGKLKTSSKFRDKLKFVLAYISCGLLAPFLVFKNDDEIEEEFDKQILVAKLERINRNLDTRKVTLNSPDPKYSANTIASGDFDNKNEGTKIDKFKNSINIYFRRYWSFMKTPKVRFLYDVTSFALFLILLNLLVLCGYNLKNNESNSTDTQTNTSISNNLSSNESIVDPTCFDYLEFVLTFWVISFLWEEIRQFIDKSSGQSMLVYSQFRTSFISYFKDEWNLLDLSGCVLYLTGFTLHQMSHADVFNNKLNNAARLLFCIDLFIWHIKLLHVTLAIRFIGPKLVMIRKMLQDLLLFIFIIFVFMVAFGVATQAAMFPGNKLNKDLLRNIVDKAYWPMLGNTENIFKDINNDTRTSSGPQSEGQVFSYIALMAYLVIINVLLLNLLIAVFSNTFDSIQTNTDQIWKFQRYNLVMEYCEAPLYPAPFNIFESVCRCICSNVIKKCEKRYLQPEYLLKPNDIKELNDYEEKICLEYLNNVAVQKNGEADSILKYTLKKVNILEQNITSILEKENKKQNETSETKIKVDKIFNILNKDDCAKELENYWFKYEI